jgi:hypothetical protein
MSDKRTPTGFHVSQSRRPLPKAPSVPPRRSGPLDAFVVSTVNHRRHGCACFFQIAVETDGEKAGRRVSRGHNRQALRRSQ